jgi:Zn-dependent oligopeptidase
MSQALTKIGNITMRIFTLSKVKDNSEAVEELCNIEKCREFSEEIEKIEKSEEITPAIKSLRKLADLLSQALTKKRETRLTAVKKEAQLRKALEEEQEKNGQLSAKSNLSVI